MHEIYVSFTVSMPTKINGNVECKDVTTGKIYLPGEGWNIDDCVSCFCNSDGQQMCYETRCPASKCKNPVHLQGRCCPVCPEVFHSGIPVQYAQLDKKQNSRFNTNNSH